MFDSYEKLVNNKQIIGWMKDFKVESITRSLKQIHFTLVETVNNKVIEYHLKGMKANGIGERWRKTETSDEPD